MAEQGIHLDPEMICCWICLDVLKDPATIPCGHSYCLSCINSLWDEQAEKSVLRCPQCRETFPLRPVLVKNTILADPVEDVGTGRKQDAIKSERSQDSHLQLHYEPNHELKRVFCRTHQECICYLCSKDEHKGHDTVSAAAERTERQKELEVSQQNLQQRIQDREKDVELLQQEVEAINRSADKAVDDSNRIFTGLISVIKKQTYEVRQQIRSQQKTEVGRATELQDKLEEEIADLRRKHAELEQLSLTADKRKPSLTCLDKNTHSPSSNTRPLKYFEGVTATVSQVRDKLCRILNEEWPKISLTVTEVDVLLTPPQPKTRAELLQYSCEITLDPNTVNPHVLLSEGNRKATLVNTPQLYHGHPDRFLERWQVLSTEGLSGRCYWEVKRNGVEAFIAVAYKDISRTGTFDACAFGNNSKSWGLASYKSGYHFKHSNVRTPVSGPLTSRVGVYLDHSAGILSFYSVSKTVTLLHRVQTEFTQPLYVGFWLPNTKGDTVELCSTR